MMLRKRLLAGAAAIALMFGATAGFADTPGTPVTQSATHSDASNFWIGQANGATSCNAVSQTSASDTLTIPAVAGQYAYLTELVIQISTDATGATAVPTITPAGIGASGGVLANLSAATTLATTGYPVNFAIPMPVGGLKGSAPGTAITFTPSAAMGAHSILCMSAMGFYNNN